MEINVKDLTIKDINDMLYKLQKEKCMKIDDAVKAFMRNLLIQLDAFESEYDIIIYDKDNEVLREAILDFSWCYLTSE